MKNYIDSHKNRFKFRAYNRDLGRYINLESITEDILNANPFARYTAKGTFVPNEPHITIEMFTGMLDSEGEEIYENDSIKNIKNGKTYDVLWEYSEAMFVKTNTRDDDDVQPLYADLKHYRIYKE